MVSLETGVLECIQDTTQWDWIKSHITGIQLLKITLPYKRKIDEMTRLSCLVNLNYLSHAALPPVIRLSY